MNEAYGLAARAAAALLAGTMLASPALADEDDDGPGRGAARYEVAITNLTPGQFFSPPVVATHTARASVFEPGADASPELILVAEDGAAGPLADLLASSREVFDVTTGTGPIPPGQTAELVVSARGAFDRISVVSMLVNTNDAFLGIDRRLPRGRGNARAYSAVAYDAGSEVNDELCDAVPGPACPAGSGNGGEDESQVILVHNGVHGVGNLSAADHDWRNPVARIVVTRVR